MSLRLESSPKNSESFVTSRREFLAQAAVSSAVIFSSVVQKSVPRETLQRITAKITESFPDLFYEKQGWEQPGFVGISDQEFANQEQRLQTEHIPSVEELPIEDGALHTIAFSIDTPSNLLYRVDAQIVPDTDQRHTVEARIYKNGKRLYENVKLLAPLVRSDDLESTTMNLWEFEKGEYVIKLFQEETSSEPFTKSDIKNASVHTFSTESLWGRILAYSPIAAVDPERVGDVDNDGLLAMFSTVTANEVGEYVVSYQFIASGQRRGTPPKKHREVYGQDTDGEWMAAIHFSRTGKIEHVWYQGQHHQRKDFNGEWIDEHPLLQIDYGNNNYNENIKTNKWYVMVPEIVSAEIGPREYIDLKPSLMRIATAELALEGKLDADGMPK